MPLEQFVEVDLDPSLEAKVRNNEDALFCVTGLAYLSAVLLEASRLPEFKRSLSLRLDEFLRGAGTLTPHDFRGTEEVERAKLTSNLWYEVGHTNWEEMGLIDWSPRHTKVNIQRPKASEARFILNISPFGANKKQL